MKGFISPVAFHAGLPCSGHGIPIPPAIHSTQPCGTPPIPQTILIKSKQTMVEISHPITTF